MTDDRSKKYYLKTAGLFAYKLLHFLLVLFSFYAAWLFFRYNGIPNFQDVAFRYNYYVFIGYFLIIYFFHRTYNAYLLGYSRIRTLVLSQTISQIFSVAIIYLVVSLAWMKFMNPLILIGLLVFQFVLNVVWCYTATRIYSKVNPPRKTILVYRNQLDRKRFGSVRGKPSGRLYRIENEIMYDGNFVDLVDELEGYEAVFVAGVNSRCRNGILKFCQERNIPGFFLPHVGDVIMLQAQHIQSFDSPVMYVNQKTLNIEYAVIKRAFDIAASLLGLIALSPILIITAIAIRVYDGGPAIYKQVRLTKGGREFKIWKFRSMRVDAEKDGVARLSTGDNDDRITPIGRIVRKCRLDELPQLVNILRGDMSVVGPRPERPEIAEQYYKTMPDFQLRLQVKAGLTGYAQVYGKYNTDPYEKLEFDLMYIKNMSVLTDLRLMFATFRILFMAESTEGIAGGQTTALMTESDLAENSDSAQTN